MMMKKNIFFLLLTLFVSGEVLAQTKERVTSNPSDKVRAKESTNKKINNRARLDIKDGSMYLGEYIEETDQDISIRLLTDDVVTINKTNIRRARTPLNSIVLNKGRYHRTTGMYMHYSLGFNGGYSGAGFMGDIGLGYRINERLEVQAGLGFIGTLLTLPNIGIWEYKTFFPSYVGASYNLTHGNCRLVAFGKVGYSTAPLDNVGIFNFNAIDVSGGAYFEPGIGVTFAGKRIGRTQISLSQISQHSNFSFSSTDNFQNLVEGTGKIWINRIGLRLTTTIF